MTPITDEEKVMAFMKENGISIYRMREITLTIQGMQYRREALKSAARRMAVVGAPLAASGKVA